MIYFHMVAYVSFGLALSDDGARLLCAKELQMVLGYFVHHGITDSMSVNGGIEISSMLGEAEEYS